MTGYPPSWLILQMSSHRETPLPPGTSPSGTPPLTGKSCRLVQNSFPSIGTPRFPGTSPSGNMPLGNPPLRGISSRLVNTKESPSTGTSQPSGQSRAQLHDDDVCRELRAENKVLSLEAKLAQEHDRIVDSETASELQDRQLRAALEQGDRPSTATEDHKVKMLEAALAKAKEDLAQAREEIKNLKAAVKLQVQKKDKIIMEQKNTINNLLQACEESSSGAASAYKNDTELQDFSKEMLKDLHELTALGETHTRDQEQKMESLRSIADQLVL